MVVDHVVILRCFDELRFNLGKKTLVDFLKGDSNPSIDRNNLDELNSYGALYMHDAQEIFHGIDELIKNRYLETKTIMGGFVVIARTVKGGREIFEKKFVLKEKQDKSSSMKVKFNEKTKITEQDKKLFSTFDFFLNKFNDEQKKAIISPAKNILCIAGAGSGKTTVLTKRIEFLKKFKGEKEENILAITFTKKAKEEMQSRIESLGILNVKVETFNSFCEKILKKHGDLIYDRQTRVAQYKDKLILVRWSLEKLGTKFETILDDYFNKRQLREKNPDELFFVFVNDIFTIIDFYKNLEEKVEPFYERETNGVKKRISKLSHDLVLIIQKELKKRGLRDFSDQIVDVLNLFKQYPKMIPKYTHILIDEYQDLNLIQFEFVKLLNSDSIFAVGDPRQAIYGWRGSDIKFILDFPENFKGTEVISLKKNYRSSKRIVDLFNKVIKPMDLVDLESGRCDSDELRKNNLGLGKKLESESKSNTSEKSIYLQEFDKEFLERIFIMEAIKNSKNPRNEIFILARTNRILSSMSDILTQNGIDYVIKSEEDYTKKSGIVNGEVGENQVVLATIHSIKGMEAKEVYVISSNTLSFPNKVQDNFVLSLVKEDNHYDKYAEELRLFYVALSRAKEKLIITYTGNLTKFITDEMLESLDNKKKNKDLFQFGSNSSNPSGRLNNRDSSVLKNMLKDWRRDKSEEMGDLPVYMILSNAAIDELAKYKPSSKAKMFNIKGMGSVKIAKYGDEILKIICG